MRKLVVVASLMACICPAVAHAEPTQWADHRTSIPAGESRELGVAGTLTFRVLSPKGKLLAKTVCPTTATETFRNEAEHGQGEIETITFAGCGVAPATLLWPTLLEARPTFYLDEWHGVALNIGSFGVFSGTLTPKIGDVDDVNNWVDDDDDHLFFAPAVSSCHCAT